MGVVVSHHRVANLESRADDAHRQNLQHLVRQRRSSGNPVANPVAYTAMRNARLGHAYKTIDATVSYDMSTPVVVYYLCAQDSGNVLPPDENTKV